MSGGPLQPGERVVLVDRKGRKYTIRLAAGAEFHTHTGRVGHDVLIGRNDGATVVGTGGTRYVVVRPTLSDAVVGMPRGAQVIYPKDLGAIVIGADIRSGCRVLEAGVGSGALSMTMVSVGAYVIGYEIREDFAQRARHNVEAFCGEGADFRVEIRDVYEGIECGAGAQFDRVVLDLPEPWRVVAHAEAALVPGGLLASYLPTINQVWELRSALEHSSFGLVETVEVLHRTWHIEGRSVRPDHRMVAHTGFITTARLVGAERAGRE